MSEASEIRPQPGFQEAYLGTTADIAVGGGSAGAGKSWCSVVDPLRWVHVDGFSAVVFRRTSPELTGAGSVWEEACELYPQFGGRMLDHKLTARFPSKGSGRGSVIEFRHLQHENDKKAHQSKQYALVVFEEVTHFTETQFWYLVGRARSLCGVKPYVRATCNPDPDSFVAKLIEWWIDQETGFPIEERAGVIRWFIRSGDEIVWADSKEELLEKFGEKKQPLSFTFIPGKLEENRVLMETDPAYLGKLESLPRVERERLLRGNWKIKPAAGMYFQSSYFEIVDELPSPIAKVIRFWDKAATEPSEKNKDPDYTAGVKMARLEDGRFAVLHVERFRGTPGKVDVRMKNLTTHDGIETKVGVFQDPGQAGKVDVAHMKRLLTGSSIHVTRTTTDKVTAAGPFSAQAEAGRVVLLRGPWNGDYIAELEDFPDGNHDDQVDGSSGAFNALQRREISHA